MGAADVTQVIAAIDWITQHRNDNGLHIRVLNIAFGLIAADTWNKDALSYAIEMAWKAGIVVVAADGNGGKGTTKSDPGINSPAYNYDVIAVGSYDHNGTPGYPADDFVSPYTSGATSSNKRNPDLVAPGAHVPSLHAVGASMDEEIMQDCVTAMAPPAPGGSLNPTWTSPVFGTDNRFVKGSGTSQAAAMVSGLRRPPALQVPRPDQRPSQVHADEEHQPDPRRHRAAWQW